MQSNVKYIIKDNQKTSVTIIANGFTPEYIIDLANGLTLNGVRVDLLGSDIYDISKLENAVNFINIRGSHEENVPKTQKVKRILSYYSKLLVYIVRTSNKIFHVQYLRFNFFEGIVLNLIYKIFGKTVVYTAHNVLPHNSDNVYNKTIFYFIYHIADVLIVHTDFIKQRIVNEFKIKSEKIEVVKHGVFSVKQNSMLDRKKARDILGLRDIDKTIIFFGNITYYKGLGILISAFSECLNEIVGLKLIIAGKVAISYKCELDRLLSDKNIKDSVITMFKYVSENEIEVLFKAGDVVVLPYLEASQSGVLFLSYAYGKPVIASDIGSFPDDIITGTTGYLFKKNDSLDLAHKIKQCFDELWPKREQVELFIKNHSNDHYSWKKIGKDLERIYQEANDG